MSRIGQLNELKALREDMTNLHRRLDALLEEICTTDEAVQALKERVSELEPKRKPKKDAE